MFLTAQGGFLGPFCWLLGKVLNFIYETLSTFGIENLALTIILFTVVIKLILLPFTLKQQRGSKINQYIQPELQKIQKKYRNKTDQDSMLKQQKETQEVYRKYGTSMTNGCLLTFIQFPIIFALYRVVYNIPAYVPSIKELYTPIAQQILKVNDYLPVLSNFVDENKITTATQALNNLTKMNGEGVGPDHIINVISQFSNSQWSLFGQLDVIAQNEGLVNIIHTNAAEIDKLNQFILGINISEAPGWKLSWALIIPITCALFQFLSTKTMSQPTMAADDPAAAQSAAMMKSMNITMPLMSLFFTITLPAAVGLYWVSSSFISFITQLFINLYYDKIADKEKILEKQMEKAKKKNKKAKKSFMERMLEAAEGQNGTASSTNSAAGYNLKNYSSGENKTPGEVTYKKGSIASKANIMQQYNSQHKGKEE